MNPSDVVSKILDKTRSNELVWLEILDGFGHCNEYSTMWQDVCISVKMHNTTHPKKSPYDTTKSETTYRLRLNGMELLSDDSVGVLYDEISKFIANKKKDQLDMICSRLFT